MLTISLTQKIHNKRTEIAVQLSVGRNWNQSESRSRMKTYRNTW